MLDVVERTRMPVDRWGRAAGDAAAARPVFDARDLSAVQALIVGGAPVVACAGRARRGARFGAAYSIRYSSTESGGVGTGDGLRRPR